MPEVRQEAKDMAIRNMYAVATRACVEGRQDKQLRQDKRQDKTSRHMALHNMHEVQI